MFIKPTCPVCRVTIEDDVEPLRKCRPPCELSNAPHFELTTELKVLQAKMASLFQRQKNRGGIIEVGADESNVISIDDEEPEPTTADILKDSSTVDALSSNSSKMTAQQRVTCRNHRQIQPTVAAVAPPAKPAERKEAKKDESEDEDEEDGRHRRHHHHHDHHRRGGNRHNRRRQYHTSHSQPQESSSNGQQSSTGSASR